MALAAVDGAVEAALSLTASSAVALAGLALLVIGRGCVSELEAGVIWASAPLLENPGTPKRKPSTAPIPIAAP